MASFGEQLRQAREAQQMTLQEISAATKISRRSLQALEEEQFDRLPGGIFNKGFVRAYARYVGLDEEKAVADYLAASKTEEEPVEATQAPDFGAEAGDKGLALLERVLSSKALSGMVLIRVLAVIVALALGWLWWKEHRREAKPQPPVQAVGAPAGNPAAAPAAGKPAQPAESAPAKSAAETKPATEAKSAPEAKPGTQHNSSPSGATSATQAAAQKASQGSPSVEAPAPQKQAAPSTAQAQPATNQVQPVEEQSAAGAEAPIQVTLTATQKSWVRVISDKKEIETLIMDPDQPGKSRRSYSAREKLKVVAGYPEGLTVTYNGKPAGDLGRDGQPLTIIFTPKGMKTFLAKGP